MHATLIQPHRRVFSLQLAAAASLALSACSSSHVPPARPVAMIDGIAKSGSEIAELTQQAEGGSADAATQLAMHFSLVEMDEAKAGHWYRKAAQLGGAHEKEVYQSHVQALDEFERSQPQDAAAPPRAGAPSEKTAKP